MAAQGRSLGNRKVQENLKTLIDTEGNIFITPVQIAEIYAGILPKEKAMVEGFLSSLGTITINEKVGRLAGEYMNKYGKSHNLTLRAIPGTPYLIFIKTHPQLFPPPLR